MGATQGHPWAHWKGASHFFKSSIAWRQSSNVNLSPNIMAPKNMKLKLDQIHK